MTAVGLLGAGLAALAIAVSGGGEPAAPEVSQAAAAAAGLSPAELSGQRLIAGWNGADPPRGLVQLIRRGRLAGVILFEDNIGSRRSTRRAIQRLQRIKRPEGLDEPLLVMVDQEGGQVKRLSGPPDASAERMGSRGAAYARREGRRTARSLAGVGFNVDLAPVLDVARPGGAIERTDRGFGGRPGRVIAAGVKGFARGLGEGGVIATAKHFPGIGMIATNTDFATQTVSISKRRLRRRDERPFGAFSANGGRMMMTSLAVYSAFADRPAALSRTIVAGELRRRLGFDGVVITDALDAVAARAFGSQAKVATAAAHAGNDLLLYSDWRQARRAGRTLRRRVGSDRLTRADFERSAARVLELRAQI